MLVWWVCLCQICGDRFFEQILYLSSKLVLPSGLSEAFCPSTIRILCLRVVGLRSSGRPSGVLAGRADVVDGDGQVVVDHLDFAGGCFCRAVQVPRSVSIWFLCRYIV